MAQETTPQDKARVVPIRDQIGVVRELDNYVEKSFDLSQYGGGSTSEIWREEISAWMEGQLLKSLFFSEDWIFIIVDLIANKISSQTLQVMRSEIRDGEEITEPAPEHPLNELLEQPNEWQDYHQFMYNWVVEFILMGNGVVWNAPSSGQLIVLPTENLTLDFDNKGRAKEYIMSSSNDDQHGLRETADMQRFAKKNIMHARRPNPNSLLWGLSPFIAGRKSILFNRYSSDYLNAFYLKQATPGLALSLDRMVNEDVALRQLKSFEQAYQGRKNARRTLVLPKGVTATPLTHSLADQKLLDHINTNRETMLGLLKVPKHELGLQTSGSLGSEEHRLALRNFWESTLKPTMDILAGSLNKYFQAELGPEYFFQFDLSDVEALQDDLKAKADIAKAMLEGGLSVNEVRRRVWQEPDSEEMGANSPFPLATLRSSAITVSPSLPEPETEQAEEETRSVKIRITDRVEGYRASMYKQLVDEEERKIKTLAGLAIDYLVGMTNAAIDVVLDALKNAQPYQTKQDGLPTASILRRRIERALSEQFEETWTTETARTLETSVDLGFDQQLNLIFNAEARQEVAALGARNEENRRLILEARALESFSDISKTHTERIMRQITRGQKRGDSITDIMRSVAEELGTPRQLAGRAETIARTETLTAVSIGQAAAVDDAQEVIPGLKKAWLTAGDDRVRDSHASLDGDVIGVKEKFDNGLRHPRDIKSRRPEETINCRCTLLLVPPEDEDILGV